MTGWAFTDHASSGATWNGVSGIDLSGGPAQPATYTYEVCFKCHADSADKPGPYVARQILEANTRLEFSPTSVSYHPVAAAGVNPDVPSLVSPYTTSSVIGCTDCHNSDTGAGAGGSGADGPHGSSFAPLLERRYALTDLTPESAQAYALCYKCHSRASILNNDSFKKHRRHIQKGTPCFVCHDAHGISAGQGTGSGNSHLINFATGIVTPNAAGVLEFIDQGRFAGSCSLTCHGKNHVDAKY